VSILINEVIHVDLNAQ